MIVSRLQGGLGNQLFQYAAGRTLADHCSQDLGLDGRDFNGGARQGNTPRPYLLNRFHLRAQVLSAFQLALSGFPQNRYLRQGFRWIGLQQGAYLPERGNAYSPMPLDSKNVYLDGYWQSWRYFQSNRPAILQDLTLLKAPQGRNALMLKRMARQNAVCIHVRRGDYVSLAAANAFHGLMGPDYYRAAIKRLGAAAKAAVFYVFSDEPAWARRNLPLPGPRVVVSHNSVLDPEEDLRLMAACRHFIIANSSLSWWGAWMGAHPTKKVVAPRRWFAAGPPTPDLCPPAWARL